MLKRALSILLVLSLFVTPCDPVMAQDDTIEVYRLPKGFICDFKVGDSEYNSIVATYMCYDLDKYKLLLTLDNDLRLAEGKVPKLELAVELLQLSNTSLQEAVSVTDDKYTVMRKDRDRLFEKWKSDNKAKHIAENKPTFGSWLPWTLTGILAAALGGTIIGIVATSGK